MALRRVAIPAQLLQHTPTAETTACLIHAGTEEHPPSEKGVAGSTAVASELPALERGVRVTEEAGGIRPAESARPRGQLGSAH